MAEAINRGLHDLEIKDFLRPSDEDEIDGEIIEFVAPKLNNDWKRFAIDKLSDEDIEHIDLDNRNVYEKCQKMLLRWKQTSKIKVTKAMLKLRLRDIHRNDILCDLIEGQGISFNERKQHVPRVFDEQPLSVNSSEAMVCDLRLKDINKLTWKLDPSFGSGINNWLQLAHAIIGKEPDLIPKVKDLELHYCGGGNPASKFLQSLSTRYPKLTVGKFQGTAQELNRNDIFVYIKENLPNKSERLSKIDTDKKEHLASLLNTNIPGINSWDMFADEYGYTYSEISVMKAAIKEEGSYSPTKRLFQLLRESKPKLKLEEIRAACRKLSRNDVVILLNEIEKEIKEMRNVR